MPRTDTIRRLSYPISHQNSTSPVHQSKSNVKINSKVSHRFVRIHHKTWTLSSVPSAIPNRGRVTQLSVSRTAEPSDSKHDAFVAKNGHTADGEVTTIPNPIPDTGFRPHPIPLSIHVVGPTASPSQLVHSVPLSQTALPMLSSPDSLPTAPGYQDLTPTPSFPTFLPVATVSTNGTSVGSGTKIHPTNATAQSHKLSIPLIVLLAVGCALILIGIFSLIKYYSRPTRHLRPRPSLPVLDDPFADDKELALEDSPIFGGKERSSNGIWSWSHYPQPGIDITKPPSIVQPDVVRGKPRGFDSVTRSPSLQGHPSNSGFNWRTQSAYSGHGHTQSVPTVTSGNSPFHVSLQQLQGALSRTATRMSAASASLYASSPGNHSNVGLAITKSPMTTFTADGSSLLKRTEPKSALDQRRNNSVAEAARDPISMNARKSVESSYTASEVSSPSFLPYTAPQREVSTNNAGRSRIKSSYYNVNSYPRISNPALASANKTQGSGSESQPRLCKLDARRDRDTQALTHALGLSSPASAYTASSPQPTLYPDDSLSVVDAKRPRKPQTSSHKKHVHEKVKEDDRRPSLPVISTAMDASAALGSLMLMDFAGNTTRFDDLTTKRLSVTSLNKATSGGVGAKSGPGPPLVKTSTSSKRNSLKSNDKPPSIPLPELLPSLEQMGLEHANPQAYADYRSPTYSIYGLYGDDRKSGTGY